MRLKKALFLILCVSGLAAAGVRPQVSKAIPQNPILSRYFVVPPSETAMRQIGLRFEVEKPQGNGYVVIVPASKARQLLRLAPDAKLLEADITATLLKRFNYSFEGWHDFDSVQSDLKSVAAASPQLATVSDYGKSMEGRALTSIELKSKVDVGHAKPVVVITGATHGNELITVEVVLGLMHKLVDGYGKDTRLTKMVDNHDLYFIPVINPDGYVRMERYMNGVDPNRDYPYPQDPNHESNPAIQAVMSFMAAHRPAGSIDYHSAAAMIMYPWAWTYDPIQGPDQQMFDALTSKMAQFNNYQYGEISRTIYIAPGSSADYYYWKFHTHALGIEISQDGDPSLIPSMLDENTESTWTFIESF